MKFDVYCDIFPLLCHARDSRAKEVMYGMHIHVCTYWYRSVPLLRAGRDAQMQTAI